MLGVCLQWSSVLALSSAWTPLLPDTTQLLSPFWTCLLRKTHFDFQFKANHSIQENHSIISILLLPAPVQNFPFFHLVLFLHSLYFLLEYNSYHFYSYFCAPSLEFQLYKDSIFGGFSFACWWAQLPRILSDK